MKILYSGPITPAGQPSTGGFEAANRKNIDALRQRGVDVVEMPYPIINRKLGIIGKLAYIRLLFQPIRLFRYRKHPDVIFHSTPTKDKLLKPAVWTISMARRLGFKILTDVRAGSMTRFYLSRGNGYRQDIRRMLENADTLTVESRTYIKDIKDIIGVDRPTYYFPNTAICGNFTLPERDTSVINIFYFGRITGNKGIDIMLDAIKRLDSRFRLYLAGPIAPDISLQTLSHERVCYLGLLSHEQLNEQMKRMHIFMFPTRHVGEGQSNALIEAMSQGLVPVTSRQGFCEEVVADCGVTLPMDASAADYAAAIEHIASGHLNAAALKCRRHIMEYHNLDIEIDKLIELYKNILSAK